MDSEDEYLYDATDSGNESPEAEEDEEDHVSHSPASRNTFFKVVRSNVRKCWAVPVLDSA